MRLPNFLYVGTAKAGSTWIYEALKAHPEVYVPPAKDVAFFSDYYDRGVDWYAEFFEAATPEHRAIGEIAVTYLLNPETMQRIADVLPDVRILVGVRNPIERAWSAYTYLVKNNRAVGSFSEEIRKSPDEAAWVIRAGQYDRCLTDLDRILDGNDVSIFVFDDLQNDPASLSKELYAALGVDDTFDFQNASRNFLPASTPRYRWLATFAGRSAIKARRMGLTNFVGHVKSSPLVQKFLYKPIEKRSAPTMSDEDWAFLAELYEPDIRHLEKRLQRDFSHWRVPKSRAQ